MSKRIDHRRGRLAGVAVAFALAFAAVPVAAQASAVNLATAGPFVVLGGSSVANTGPSVLNGDLGLAPGTSLIGFGLPAVVNGATHANDAVAVQAQADLTTAYDVAAGQPIPAGNNLTGTDLGSRTLTAGAYGFSTSAQLTGQLTLDAQGDPNAQFVFVIGTTLTTASASSVILTNGASPCNVYWKVGTSATLGTGTTFIGNVMALESITAENAVTVTGRLLARNGKVSLSNDVLGTGGCATGSATTPTGSETGEANKAKKAEKKGTATLTRGKATAKGVRATVRGKRIKSVTFSVDGKRVSKGPKTAMVPTTPGRHVVTAHVTFTDSTSAKTIRFNFRVPFPVVTPRFGPSQFTG